MSVKKEIPLRRDADPKYTWRTEDLFASDELWEKEYAAVTAQLPEIETLQATLASSAQGLLHCLRSIDAVSERAEKVYVYANLKFHEDSANSVYQTMSNKSEMLMVKYSSATAYFIPELLKIPEKTVERYMEQEKGLAPYRHMLENIIRQKPHTLSPQEEKLLAKCSEISGAGQNIFVMLNEADLKFPSIKDENGETAELTKGRYTRFLESSDRRVRHDAFTVFYDTYLKQKNTLAAAYYASVKKDCFYADVRNYSSAMSMALDDDNIPVSVYQNLLDTVHAHLPLLHRYIDLRKRLLGVPELHMYDLYTPLVPDAEMTIPYSQAKEMVKKGLAPLGEDYIQLLEKGFTGGWIDVYENQGKRGGAYSWGAYPGHPFVLLNHNDTINSMFTVAHEMGHALHSYYTWQTQPYAYSGHKIFVAEVASTVNEALLMKHLLNTTEDKNTKRYLINYFLEQFRGTLFRQTMFAEFELQTHEMVQKGEPLTCENLSSLYHELNRKYFGDAIVIDHRIDIEWARIPHFYTAFYVYQYATGYSAAIALSEKILTEGAPAVAQYKDFLSKGNSEYSIDLLKGAGIDMSQKEPLEKAMAVFESLLEEMEKL